MKSWLNEFLLDCWYCFRLELTDIWEEFKETFK